MNIAILSDSHNNWDNLTAAIGLAQQRGCKVFLFAGDLVQPDGVGVLAECEGVVHMIHGNNERQLTQIEKRAGEHDNIHYHGDEFAGEVGGVAIFMHHYPQEAEAAARQDAEPQMYDVCIYGHTHTRREEWIGDTLLLNPGALHRAHEYMFAVYDTDSREVEFVLVK